MAMKKPAKKAVRAAEKNVEESSNAEAEPTIPRPSPERRPRSEPQYIQERRNLEDLWQAAFPVGTEWDNMDKLNETKWDFTKLEEAFEEGGLLHEKKVYLFGLTEPVHLPERGELVLMPVVVAVDSPFPPSDKLGLASVQKGEEIISMKQMKMAWVPYVPLENRQRTLEKVKVQIYTMACTQRRSALKHLKIERVKEYDYCMPYIPSLTEQKEIEADTCVNIIYPTQEPIVCEFDWNVDNLEYFTDELIESEELSKDKKEDFKEFVKELVRAKKKEQKEAREARKKMLEEMDPEKKFALENMKVYKFYPLQAKLKANRINRYYRNADVVI